MSDQERRGPVTTLEVYSLASTIMGLLICVQLSSLVGQELFSGFVFCILVVVQFVFLGGLWKERKRATSNTSE